MFTPYAEVNELLDVLVTRVRDVLGPRLTGVYLYGSLASGDFNPRSSDIDFVVVTDGDLPDAVIAALAAMHRDLWTSGMPWAAKLEGSYISQHAFRRYDPSGGPYPTVNEEQFYLGGHGSDWIIQRHIVREQGVVLMGPAPQTLIDPVAPDDLRCAIAGILYEWWAYILHENPGKLAPRLYQAYAVLTMCRALYTLRQGTVASKPVSARWAQAALDPRWQGLIERALRWPEPPQYDEMIASLDFIRFTLARTQEEIPSC